MWQKKNRQKSWKENIRQTSGKEKKNAKLTSPYRAEYNIPSRIEIISIINNGIFKKHNYTYIVRVSGSRHRLDFSEWGYKTPESPRSNLSHETPLRKLPKPNRNEIVARKFVKCKPDSDPTCRVNNPHRVCWIHLGKSACSGWQLGR